MSGAAVTPSGVREGDPAALAALCAVRGPSVLAYCRQVAGEAEAVAAAADAFGAFRAAVFDAGEAYSVNPEALLVTATRHAAARRAVGGAVGICADVPELLAARAERTISFVDLERLEVHLAGCYPCRAPVARFKAAERSYRDPPETTLDPAISAQLIAALLAAAPVLPPGATAAPANGAVQPSPATDPDAAGAGADGGGAIEQPTVEFHPPGMVVPAPAGSAPVNGTDGLAGPPPREGLAHALLAALGLRTAAADLRPTAAVDDVAVEPAQAPAAAVERPSGPRPPRLRRAAASRATPARPASIRRPFARRPGSERLRGASRLAFVLPVALVLVALVAALVVAGVLGGKEPASSPRVAVPAAAPDDGPAPDVVVVSGAQDASGEDVELAKARARAQRERAEKLTGEAAPAAPSASDPAGGPAAPAPRRAAGGGDGDATRDRERGSREAEVGGGATGAEQVPTAPDAPTVPDLAPPQSDDATP